MSYGRSRKDFLFFRLNHRVHKPGHSRSKSLCFQNWTTICSLYGNIADAPYPPRKQWHLTYKAKRECGVVTAWDEAAQIKRAMEWIRDRALNTDCLQVRVRNAQLWAYWYIPRTVPQVVRRWTTTMPTTWDLFMYLQLAIQFFGGNRDSTVNTLPTLRAGRSRVRIPAGGIGFSFLQNVQTGSGAHQTSNSRSIGAFSRQYSGRGTSIQSRR